VGGDGAAREFCLFVSTITLSDEARELLRALRAEQELKLVEDGELRPDR